MREIKFRLLLHGKIVGYEKWYPGCFVKSHNHWRANPCWLYSKDGLHWNPKPIFHDGKDQFTGLKDKNGKEVYEGDIVEYGVDRSEVIWHWYGFMFKHTSGDLMGCNSHAAVETIGNIYENPELING